jgi:hypothetical protein
MVPGLGAKREPAPGDELAAMALDPAKWQQFRNQEHRVVAIHLQHPEHRDSAKSREAVGQVDLERYGDQLRLIEVDVKRYPELASMEGVRAGDAPQIIFYFEGVKVGDYHGPWTKSAVERKTDEVIRGCMERVGKDWLPKVKGMEREPRGKSPPIQPLKPKS